MKKIAIYIRSYGVSPSGYYRIFQYTNMLNVNFKLRNILPPTYYEWYLENSHRKVKIALDIFTYIYMYLRVFFFLMQDILCGYNVFVISRGLLPRYCMFPLRNLLLKIAKKGAIYWDFDDDILLSREISVREFNLLSDISSSIVVTHNYLKEKLDRKYWNKVIIMPTTDGDFLSIKNDEILEKRVLNLMSEINLVWVGSAINLIHLEKLVKALDFCAESLYTNYSIKLNLGVCSSRGLEIETKYLTITNVKWSKENAVQIILDSHIGIMPLMNSKYAQGKGGFKLVQYMAAGLPVMASNVGFNKDIVKEDFGRLVEDINDSEAWLNAIVQLSSDASAYSKFSYNSLQEWKHSYSYIDNLKIWSSLLVSSIKDSTIL